MNVNTITNKNLKTIDWAAADRQVFLKTIPKMQRQKDRDIAPCLSTRGVWMTDVSAMDRRSIKAQLAGRGDYRAFWWNINRFMQKVMNPSSTLEGAMYAFHKRHHSITLEKMRFFNEISDAAAVIRKSGFVAGVQHYQSQMKRD